MSVITKRPEKNLAMERIQNQFIRPPFYPPRLETTDTFTDAHCIDVDKYSECLTAFGERSFTFNSTYCGGLRGCFYYLILKILYLFYATFLGGFDVILNVISATFNEV